MKMKTKINYKLFLLLIIIPIILITVFYLNNNDDPVWDISTNNYYQKGVNFELLWFGGLEQNDDGFWVSSNDDNSADSITDYYSSSSTAQSSNVAYNNYLEYFGGGSSSSSSSSSYSYSSSSSSLSDSYDCRSQVKFSYKNSHGWRQYGNSYVSFTANELVPTYNSGGKVTEVKGEVFMKCSWDGNGSIMVKSGDVVTSLYSGWINDSTTFNPTRLHLEQDTLFRNNNLANGVSEKIGEIRITENTLDKVEQGLEIFQSGNTNRVGITFDVDVKPELLINGNTTYNGKLDHLSSMKFNQLLEEVGGPTNANSRYESMELVKMYRSVGKIDLKDGANTLDTSRKVYRQITMIVSMSNWYSNEGPPIAKIINPMGKVVERLSFGFDTKSGDTQYFITRYSIPQNSVEGNWTVEIENVNRVANPSHKLIIQNTPTSTPTPTPTSTPTPTPEEQSNPLQPDEMSIGLLWEIKDFNGNIFASGNSFVDGSDIIPSLSLLSEIRNPRDGKSTPFNHIELTPMLKFENAERRGDFRLGNIDIKADLTIKDDKSSGTITRYFQQIPQQGSHDQYPLGWANISRDNVDKLANNAQLQKGDVFTLQAKIYGSIKLIQNSDNKSYELRFDDAMFNQEITFGSKTKTPTSPPPEEQGLSLQEQCEANGNFWLGGSCYSDKNDYCESKGAVLNWVTQECELPIPDGQKICEDDLSGTWENNICLINGTPTDPDESIILEMKMNYCIDLGGAYNIRDDKCLIPSQGNDENESTITGNGSFESALHLLCGDNSLSECVGSTTSSFEITTEIWIIIIMVFFVIIIAVFRLRRSNPTY